MDLPRQIQSSFYTPQLPLDESDFSRHRQPLADSAGNAQIQLHAGVSSNHYHDGKANQTRIERHICRRCGKERNSEDPHALNIDGCRCMYSIPTLPSQPMRLASGSALARRHQSQHKQRRDRLIMNPIMDSPQYIAYRDRQTRDRDADDQKWPQVLENAFLEALIELPIMHRRKFSYDGKPHGRNELITRYLWLAYCESLPPGAYLDPTMKRTRKQVSSHIQVLKGFMRDHPAFHLLFPKNKKEDKNHFDDSFKNDPCLVALSQGRLPNRRYDRFRRLNRGLRHRGNEFPAIRPDEFWLILKRQTMCSGEQMHTPQNEDVDVLHRFTVMNPSPRSRSHLETIDGWRRKFPLLHDLLQDSGSASCEIIHMHVSLKLLSAPPEGNTQLLSRTFLSIPGGDTRNCNWRIVSTLKKPIELCSNAYQEGKQKDHPVDRAAFRVEVVSGNDNETRINVPFPGAQFAYVFSCLVSLQEQYREQTREHQEGRRSNVLVRSPGEYLEDISLFQELEYSADEAQDVPFAKRAVFIWTFSEAQYGEPATTTWRYVDPMPSRRMVMSPSPHPSHHLSAAMNAHFNAFTDKPPLQHPSLMNNYFHALVTPPSTAGLQSPFETPFQFSQQPFDLPSENLSFISITTIDSESTLVGNAAANLENFLSNGSNVNLLEFNHDASDWQLATTEGFNADASYSYDGSCTTNTPAVSGWETPVDVQVCYDLSNSKLMNWSEEQQSRRPEEWINSSADHNIDYLDPEQKILLMQEYHDPHSQDSYADVQGPVEMEMEMDAHDHQEDGQVLQSDMNGHGYHGNMITTTLNSNIHLTSSNGSLKNEHDHVQETKWHDADDEFDYA